MSVYKDKQTGEKVRIIKEDNNFYTLDNEVKIKKETFAKRYSQTDEIDPDDFFKPRTAIEQLAHNIKSMDTSKVSESGEPTKIKYKPPTVIQDNSRNETGESTIQISEDQKQRMIEEWKMKQELGEKGAKPPPFINQTETDNSYIEYEMPGQGEGNLRQTNTSTTEPTISNPTNSTIDPMQMMFKMFKNNYNVKINLEFQEKIANPQFIQMIMENVEGDAVEYYTKIIMDKIIKNPLKLKKEIYRQLKIEIFGEEVVLEEERLEVERLEAERLENEKLEAEKLENERLENERKTEEEKLKDSEKEEKETD